MPFIDMGIRRKLEDLVIDLFREKDVSIRVTLGQIVASLSKVTFFYVSERCLFMRGKRMKLTFFLSLSLMPFLFRPD